MPVTPPGGSAELVLAGIERKRLDPKRYEFADSEQSDPETEPHAHTPLKPARVFPEPRMDSEGNPLVTCRFCGDSVVRAIDEKYNKPVYLQWVPGNAGKFFVRNGKASWWGPRGSSYIRHECQKQTLSEQAG